MPTTRSGVESFPAPPLLDQYQQPSINTMDNNQIEGSVSSGLSSASSHTRRVRSLSSPAAPRIRGAAAVVEVSDDDTSALDDADDIESVRAQHIEPSHHQQEQQGQSPAPVLNETLVSRMLYQLEALNNKVDGYAKEQAFIKDMLHSRSSVPPPSQVFGSPAMEKRSGVSRNLCLPRSTTNDAILSS